MFDETMLRDRIRGCLHGVAIGDALGAPVETMTAQAIRQATDGKGVTDYRAPLQRRIRDTMRSPPGHVTDDTQLTLAVAASLSRTGRFDLADVGKAHVQALFGDCAPPELRRRLAAFDASAGTKLAPRPSQECSWMGTGMRWGKTTEAAVVEIARFIASDGAEGRDPTRIVGVTPDGPSGLGTGPAMKVAGIALAYRPVVPIDRAPFVIDRSSTCVRHVWNLAAQTHHDARAAHAAVAMALAIGTALATARRPGPDAAGAILHRCIVGTKARESADRFLPRFKDAFGGEHTVSARLGKIADHLDTPHGLLQAIGAGFSSLEAVPFAIGVALRNVDDVEAGLLEAVNAGGDADTTASMVGAILGARHGMDGLPSRLVAGLRKGVRLDIDELAPKLAKLALKEDLR